MIGIYLLIGVVSLLYVYLKWTFSYWDRISSLSDRDGKKANPQELMT